MLTSNAKIIKATFDDLKERNNVIVEYEDENGFKIDAISTVAKNPILDIVYDKFTQTEIYEMTMKENESIHKFYKDMNEFIKYRNNGNIKIEERIIEKESEFTLNLESLKNMNIEDLFKLKLEIFEDPNVQESEDRECRSKIRKSKDLMEVMYYYYIIKNDIQQTEQENFDLTIEGLSKISEEKLFKLKIEIFETPEVQVCENSALRRNIRSADNLIDVLSAYKQLINYQNSQSEKSLE